MLGDILGLEEGEKLGPDVCGLRLGDIDGTRLGRDVLGDLLGFEDGDKLGSDVCGLRLGDMDGV